jgi:hypothetical protein
MNYSLFIMVPKDIVSMESKGQPGMASATSVLLSSQFVDPYCVFHVSLLPPREGVAFIVSFRSRWFRQAKVCSIWTHEGEIGPHHAVRILGHTVGRLSYLVVFHIDFFFSRSLISRNNDVAKRLGPFDTQKVPKSKKHEKKSKFASQC